jgi:hypothetical protein
LIEAAMTDPSWAMTDDADETGAATSTPGAAPLADTVAWQQLDAETVKQGRASLNWAAGHDARMLTHYASALKNNFQVKGPLYTESADGRLEFAAFEISHAKFGLLVRVGESDRLTTPGGNPRDLIGSPDDRVGSGHVVNRRV